MTDGFPRTRLKRSDDATLVRVIVGMIALSFLAGLLLGFAFPINMTTPTAYMQKIQSWQADPGAESAHCEYPSEIPLSE